VGKAAGGICSELEGKVQIPTLRPGWQIRCSRRIRSLLPPNFLWSLAALANLMRLSLLKAAHAVMSGAAYRKSGSPILLNPGTLWRTWGTRPGGEACEEAKDLSHHQCMTLIGTEG
jgi:hypothetical protein